MISTEEVLRVARLARLHLEEDELEHLQKDLSRIIDYVRQLSMLDLSGLPPTSHAVHLRNVFRPDEPLPGLSQDEALSNAPAAEAGHFVVPRIV